MTLCMRMSQPVASSRTSSAPAILTSCLFKPLVFWVLYWTLEQCHVRLILTNIALGLSRTFLHLSHCFFSTSKKDQCFDPLIILQSVRAVLASWPLLLGWTPRLITWPVFFLVPATEGPMVPSLVFQLHHQALTASSSMWEEYQRAHCSLQTPHKAELCLGALPCRLKIWCTHLLISNSPPVSFPQTFPRLS